MERALELIHKYLDGVAVAAELTELETLVLARTDVADAFAAATRLDSFLLQSLGHQRGVAHLRSLLTGPTPEPAPKISLTQPRRFRPLLVFGGVAVAASLLLVIGIAVYALRGGNAVGTQVLAGRLLVNGVESNQFSAGSQVRVVGEQNAVLRLADGSRLELTPKTEAVVHGRTAAHRELIELHSGGGKFEVTQGAGDFQIDTTAGEVTVLGTSFTILLQTPEQLRRERLRVRPDWKLTVAVTTGSVQVRQDGSKTILAAGERNAFVKANPPNFIGRIESINEVTRRVALQVQSRRDASLFNHVKLRLADDLLLVNMERLAVGQEVQLWLDPQEGDAAYLILLAEATQNK